MTPLYTIFVLKLMYYCPNIYILWLKVPFQQSENLQKITKAKNPIFHTFLELSLKTNNISKSSFPRLSKFNLHFNVPVLDANHIKLGLWSFQLGH
jgi:hypothetical protein